ncbi:ApeP family dehydratase [Salinicola rhizosphaerae]|uniref:3-hydroxylacyl-ACP dehydratase n=1 Tax=Salinicola rhizosphaerae TaxID=1443141 RepID=A0ABQ3DWL9_9GAMM|nr:hypothetical protein [Salinicola rhizosphaerae]GHB16157.1 hypothetical protein GCM10009038_13250 [Salinicola rhizosphaerae]
MTRRTLPCAIEPLIPHARGMCLLTRLLAATDDTATTEALTRRDDLFATVDGIPAWVGIEWLAQSVAAWSGYRAEAQGESPATGLLLGSRRYRSRLPTFPFDRRVRVEIHVDFVADNGVTQVNGSLHWADDADALPLAEGSLTLYRPGG